MNTFFTYLFLLISCFVFSQARLTLNNDPYIVISNGISATPAYLVIDNPAANAITLVTPQVNGGVKTESEFNIVKWNIGANTGNYIIPFTKAFGGPAIPFSANITAAGATGGSIKFSSYRGGTWDNSTYMPSDVTNMSSAVGGPNNSSKVIDRFWIIDANSYTTKPSATFSFTYIDSEWGAAGNAIVEGNLGAQRFEPPPIGSWGNYAPQGTISTAANTITGVPVSPANFYRSWTLTDNTSPLPIELVSFDGNCLNGTVTLRWTTISETNNDFFTVEKSEDGINFHSIETLNGAGNSNSTINYLYTVKSTNKGTVYYRLKQTDYNGISKYFNAISVEDCNSTTININVYNDQQGNIVLSINANETNQYRVALFDVLGKIIIDKQFVIEEGPNNFSFNISTLNAGVYFIKIDDKIKPITKKIFVR
jgi:hypothetical protein